MEVSALLSALIPTSGWSCTVMLTSGRFLLRSLGTANRAIQNHTLLAALGRQARQDGGAIDPT